MNLNRVYLLGHVVVRPEVRTTPGGTSVADLKLAVPRFYTTPAGEKREETAYPTIVLWGRLAENSAEFLDNGRPVLVEGRLQTRDDQGRDGQRHTALDVIGESVQSLGRGRESAPARAQTARDADGGDDADGVPF